MWVAVERARKRAKPCSGACSAEIYPRRSRESTVCASQPPLDSDMAYIPYVPYDQASGLLTKLYQEYAGPARELDNIVRIHSLNPRSMRDHVELYAHLMRGPSPLTRVQREMLAVVVSAENDCFY
jgi:hypothetical protein